MPISTAQVSDAAVNSFRDETIEKLTYVVGKTIADATDHDWFIATAHAVRDRIIDRWIKSDARSNQPRTKRVYYLSVEFLIGRLLFDSLTNLGLVDVARAALSGLNVDIDHLRAIEPDAALGNGGLGRLAACFMDSMSSLGIPAIGYGIRYEQGLFTQLIQDGWQHELPEDWLAFGNPWEFARPDTVYPIHFGGAVDMIDGDGARGTWHPSETAFALAHDTPIVGWRGAHVNMLRLWAARADNPNHLPAFTEGDYSGETAAQTRAQAISSVLYPSDATPDGQELRLRQEYFFTSASLQDLVARHLAQFGDLSSLSEHAAIQLNDTHPAIAVAELMRILVDEREFSWTAAWQITQATLSYTNHTLLPEALESWPVALMRRLLPRHLRIIEVINWHHLRSAAEHGISEPGIVSRLSLISEPPDQRVRMGNLAFVGSHKVNGVSALHTDLMRKTVFHDLALLAPGRIVNKTNGISFRRWLFQTNPALTALLVRRLGDGVLDGRHRLRDLERMVDDPGLISEFTAIKRANKQALASRIRRLSDLTVDTDALFDVHIKRIHEYKRQLLNILETIALYNAMRTEPQRDWTPRVKIFAGKAAGSYVRAKLIIKLIHDVGRVINGDRSIAGRLKVVFLPDYNVSMAEEIIPAADLSEQISTAGFEASGTGNMKLALNGALTIGTLDGANVEMREQLGADNIFIFGLTSDQVADRQRVRFMGRQALETSPILANVMESLAIGTFSPGEPNRFRPIVDAVLDFDPFMVAADFDAYWQAQRSLDELWQRSAAWRRISILNTARMGWFSSDRAIRDYADEIWHVAI